MFANPIIQHKGGFIRPMKIEKLTDNKIRIILNIDDLAKKNIDVHTLIKDNSMSQKLFKKILIEAKKEVGFDPQDCRLLIEAYISSEGFFVLTVTKILEELNKEKNSSIKPKAKRKSLNNNCSTAIYEFDSFEDFESFCTYLSNTKLNNFAKKLSLYEYEDKYFLVFSGIDTNSVYASFIYSSISEFAKLSSNSKFFESKLIEYGKTIFKNKSDINKFIKLSK